MTQPLPLAGIKVLDLSRALSGPFCAMILGDLGAEVIKVEPLPGGDMVREWGPFAGDTSVYYLSGNRNKKSVALSFRNAEGMRILREMAGKVDVVVENFRPGVMDQMGMSLADLHAGNPGLIVASITGFGSVGPKSSWPGFDQVAQGFAGFMSFTGNAESGPQRVGVAIGDLTSGMWTAMGVLAAVIQRHASGRGQQVETSLLASLMGLLSVQGQRYLSLGEVARPSGNVHPVIAPYGVFEAKDGPLTVGAATQDQWVKLARLVGLEHLASDPRFLSNADRVQHRTELKALLEERLGQRDRASWTTEMVGIGIPAGPINDIADAFAEPQVEALGLVETFAHPTLGTMRQVGNPVRMDGLRDGSVRLPPPLLGQHTQEVLADFGYSPGQIRQWLEAGVVMQQDGH
ncbi:CaiB/BaiF CoA transferase family protein [Ramlibacter sp. Leaf400]|uniref:CaiB/BaiF CoA transferase family protein n=1 Tax=Ramlibacter sp. Leaf400 TaxID=1736365 RepID=UPI0007015DEE|nr:CoA transferase [Ramlibacter sp. Leaf400]KQT14205.1 CaiB/baiF CoA-transferase [Ramlibacter sp. Leaf400]